MLGKDTGPPVAGVRRRLTGAERGTLDWTGGLQLLKPSWGLQPLLFRPLSVRQTKDGPQSSSAPPPSGSIPSLISNSGPPGHFCSRPWFGILSVFTRAEVSGASLIPKPAIVPSRTHVPPSAKYPLSSDSSVSVPSASRSDGSLVTLLLQPLR